jgi:molecular chaperone DnaK (HSP70)
VSWTWSKADRPDQINTVRNWEVGNGNAHNQQADEVPSKICYDKHRKVLKWGYMVGPKDRLQVQWFKLLLSEQACKQGGERVEETKQVLRTLKKSCVDVVADYIRCLWKHAEEIELSLNKVAVDNMTFRVVLTLPANWDYSAVALTEKAASQAGIKLSRTRGPTIFRMVAEPEAAVLAAWKESGMRWRPDLYVPIPPPRSRKLVC